jgi:hypothetical protein
VLERLSGPDKETIAPWFEQKSPAPGQVLLCSPFEKGEVVSIDFYARGCLEKYTRRLHSYELVMDGTLKELVEYACTHNRGLIGLYLITVGTDKYAGQKIRDLFHNLNFPKKSKR